MADAKIRVFIEDLQSTLEQIAQLDQAVASIGTGSTGAGSMPISSEGTVSATTPNIGATAPPPAPSQHATTISTAATTAGTHQMAATAGSVHADAIDANSANPIPPTPSPAAPSSAPMLPRGPLPGETFGEWTQANPSRVPLPNVYHSPTGPIIDMDYDPASGTYGMAGSFIGNASAVGGGVSGGGGTGGGSGASAATGSSGPKPGGIFNTGPFGYKDGGEGNLMSFLWSSYMVQGMIQQAGQSYTESIATGRPFHATSLIPSGIGLALSLGGAALTTAMGMGPLPGFLGGSMIGMVQQSILQPLFDQAGNVADTNTFYKQVYGIGGEPFGSTWPGAGAPQWLTDAAMRAGTAGHPLPAWMNNVYGSAGSLLGNLLGDNSAGLNPVNVSLNKTLDTESLSQDQMVMDIARGSYDDPAKSLTQLKAYLGANKKAVDKFNTLRKKFGGLWASDQSELNSTLRNQVLVKNLIPLVNQEGLDKADMDYQMQEIGSQEQLYSYDLQKEAKYSGSAGVKASGGAYLGEVQKQVDLLLRQARDSDKVGDHAQAAGFRAQAKLASQQSTDMYWDTYFKSRQDEVSAFGQLNIDKSNISLQELLHSGKSAYDMNWSAVSGAYEKQAGDTQALMMEMDRQHKLSPAQRAVMQDQINQLRYKAKIEVPIMKEDLERQELMAGVDLRHNQQLWAHSKELNYGSGMQQASGYDLESQALEDKKQKLEEILKTQKTLTYLQKEQLESTLAQTKALQDQADKESILAKQAAQRNVDTVSTDVASSKQQVAQIEGAGGSQWAGLTMGTFQAQTKQLATIQDQKNDLLNGTNMTGTNPKFKKFDKNSPEVEALEDKEAQEQVSIAQTKRSMAVPPMSGTMSAQYSKDDTALDIMESGYGGSAGAVRKAILNEIDLGKQRIQELKANRSNLQGKGMWNNGMEADYQAEMHQETDKQLGLMQKYDEGWTDRLMSMTFNLPSSMSFLRAHFTHLDAARAGIDLPEFGGTYAQNQEHRALPIRFLQTAQSGSGEGFDLHGLAQALNPYDTLHPASGTMGPIAGSVPGSASGPGGPIGPKDGPVLNEKALAAQSQSRVQNYEGLVAELVKSLANLGVKVDVTIKDDKGNVLKQTTQTVNANKTAVDVTTNQHANKRPSG